MRKTFWYGVDATGEFVIHSGRHLLSGVFYLVVAVVSIVMLSIVMPFALLDWIRGVE